LIQGRRLLGRARQHRRTTDEAVALFGETRYAALRWSHRRRVVMKAEVVVHPGRPPKHNPRFVVTNLRSSSTTKTMGISALIASPATRGGTWRRGPGSWWPRADPGGCR
jgi:hypothetical protein